MSLYKDVQKAAARKQGVEVKEPAEVTMSNILDGPIKRPDESKLFKTMEERCADARSTAMTLLLVGVLGLAAMILAITGSLQLPLPKIAPPARCSPARPSRASSCAPSCAATRP